MSSDTAWASLPKKLYRTVVALPVLPELLAGVTHSEATVFMAHRFADRDAGVDGHDPASLRQTLAELRRRKYQLLSLLEVLRRLRDHEPLNRAVAFTIDDGYYDAAQVVPLFAAFDCPVTVFALTGFLDGKLWMWWDQITYIFEQTKVAQFRAALCGRSFEYRFEPGGARPCPGSLIRKAYQASQEQRMACIRNLSISADVELPPKPPARYRALSWEEARRLETQGATFGPHTVTHPVLSSLPNHQSEEEIAGSWERLKSQLSRPAPVLCYPGGELEDFGEREIATMRRVGLQAAVTGVPGNIRSNIYHDSSDQWFRIPRYMHEDELPDILQRVSGVERVKIRLRGRLPL